MELHSQSTISRPNDGRWREYWWFVLIFYPVAGFFFYNWHQEEAPTALAWSLFVLSPLLICVAGVIGYGLLMLSLVGVHHFFESKWFKSYEGALFHAQRQSELAKKEVVFPRKSGLRERSCIGFSLVDVFGFGSSE